MTDELGVSARRRTTRQLLIGVPIVIAWAIFAVKGPAWLVERGQKNANACINDAVEAARASRSAGSFRASKRARRRSIVVWVDDAVHGVSGPLATLGAAKPFLI